MSQNPCPQCRSDRPSIEGVCPNCGWKPNDMRKERELMIRTHADPRAGVERGSRNTSALQFSLRRLLGFVTVGCVALGALIET
jgi:hypothetical protein